jgi:hypothetical protein
VRLSSEAVFDETMPQLHSVTQNRAAVGDPLDLRCYMLNCCRESGALLLMPNDAEWKRSMEISSRKVVEVQQVGSSRVP